LRDHADFDVRFFEATALSVSSSLLRTMVARGRSIRYLVPNEVRDYIEERGLYLPNSERGFL
jgi:nicotinate-nucleotide adenylyltransferase